MNCPSRTDEPEGTGMNQSPNALAGDLTTRADLNGMANARMLRRSTDVVEPLPDSEQDDTPNEKGPQAQVRGAGEGDGGDGRVVGVGGGAPGEPARVRGKALLVKALLKIKKFGKFCGPGMMVCGSSKDVKSLTNYMRRLPLLILIRETTQLTLRLVLPTNTSCSSSS